MNIHVTIGLVVGVLLGGVLAGLGYAVTMLAILESEDA